MIFQSRLLSCMLLSAVIITSASCTTSRWELARVSSPDGRCVAVVSSKERYGIPLPGPEPPDITGRWVRLRVLREGKEVYDCGWREIDAYQAPAQVFDLLWSPDSERLACRIVRDLRIIEANGSYRTYYEIGKREAILTSFRWAGNRQLLLVSKTLKTESSGGRWLTYPWFQYGSKQIQICRLNMDGELEERFRLDIDTDRLVYRDIVSRIEEISPSATRVAFSNAWKICVYDDTSRKIIVRKPVSSSIGPMWWQDDNSLVLGIGGGFREPKQRFVLFDIPSETMKDVTAEMMPSQAGED